MSNAARQKIQDEGCMCRICGARSLGLDVDAAHTVDRSLSASGFNEPDLIVPLCRVHHREYDSHQLDLLPYLDKDEQAAMVRELGMVRALRRATGATS